MSPVYPPPHATPRERLHETKSSLHDLPELRIEAMAEGVTDPSLTQPEESEVLKEQAVTDELAQIAAEQQQELEEGPESLPEEPATDQSLSQEDTLISVWNGLRLYTKTWEPTGTPV